MQQMNQCCLWHVVLRAPGESSQGDGRQGQAREGILPAVFLSTPERVDEEPLLCIWGHLRSKGQSPVPGDFKVVEEFPEWRVQSHTGLAAHDES